MTRLGEIVRCKRKELSEAKKATPLAVLEKAVKTRPAGRGFHQAIRREGKLSLIAEVKRASPSAGSIRPAADAVEVAREYASAGAQSLSVLTDTRFFSGSLQDLDSVHEGVGLPVLRKDFLLEEYHLIESAAHRADAVLLIVGILTFPVLKQMLRLAEDLRLDSLVEVHTERELGDAIEAGAPLLGINNRDLTTFSLDLRTTERLIRKIPNGSGVTVVSESGIRSREDVRFVESQGAHAVLIGEELMGSPDVGRRVKELMGW